MKFFNNSRKKVKEEAEENQDVVLKEEEQENIKQEQEVVNEDEQEQKVINEDEQVNTEESNNIEHIEKVDKEESIDEDVKQEENIEQPQEENNTFILYFVVDNKNDNLLKYYRNLGLNVSIIFDDITEARNRILMQREPARIVVIDSGLGIFSSLSKRNELIDMLGISDDRNRISVFYSDSAIKSDALKQLGKSAKSIDWIKYKNTIVVASIILNYKEEYIYQNKENDDNVIVERDILKYKGIDCGNDNERIVVTGFSEEAIRLGIEDSEDQLERFKISI